MTELKTLKDLGYSKQEDGDVSKLELKKEAIKWIKNIIQSYGGMKFSDIGTTFSPTKDLPFSFVNKKLREEGSYCCAYSMIALLKHFFNITEEDLE